MTEQLRFPSTTSRFGLSQLQSIHHQIINRHCLGQGPSAIARALGVSMQTVSRTLETDIAKARIKEIELGTAFRIEEIRERLVEMTPKAIFVMESVLDDADLPMGLRVKVAQDILDRAGLGAPKKVEGSVSVNYFTAEHIEELKKRVLEASGNAIRSEQVEPAEFEEVASA